MTSTKADATRNCQVCDARNTGLSLFCAECGSSLNAKSDGETSALSPRSDRDDAQQTSVFQPAAPAYDSADADIPRATGSQAHIATDGAYRPYWDTAPSPAAASDQVWSPVQGEPSTVIQHQDSLGRRGLALGLIAMFLMLAVFLLWTWASLLDQDVRDSIRDFFGFIG